MEQLTAVLHVLTSIQKQITLDEHQCDIIREHLFCLYGVGFDEGRKQGSHAKPVEQYKDGRFIRRYDSEEAAARALHVDKTSISKNALGQTTNCHGFTFRFVKQS